MGIGMDDIFVGNQRFDQRMVDINLLSKISMFS